MKRSCRFHGIIFLLQGPYILPPEKLKLPARSKRVKHTTMNITTNNVEVSTPFFHENNTTMNSYEAPLEPETTSEQSKPMQSRPEGTAGLVQWCPCEAVEKSEATQSNPMENTIFHVMQVSISHSAHRKQYNEECPFQVGASHPDCKTISNNIAREYEKIEKSREIAMQFFRPKRFVEDTNPVPWRWENRTAVPVEERGKCLLYRPVTYKMIHEHKFRQTPFCLLHENDVVDNGTVMCLKARWDECVYGNETMKAILEIDTFYRSEIKFPEIKFPEFPEIPEMSQTTWFVLIVLFFFFVGTLQKPRGGGA